MPRGWPGGGGRGWALLELTNALLWFLSQGGAGTFPIMGYTERFHPKGVLFISLRYTKGQGNILKGRRGMVVDYWYFGINCYQFQ